MLLANRTCPEREEAREPLPHSSRAPRPERHAGAPLGGQRRYGFGCSTASMQQMPSTITGLTPPSPSTLVNWRAALLLRTNEKVLKLSSSEPSGGLPMTDRGTVMTNVSAGYGNVTCPILPVTAVPPRGGRG